MALPSSPFLRFFLVGALAMLVDMGALWLIHTLAGVDVYLARVGSFLVAATFAWALNRTFTFREADTGGPIAQWLRYLSSNSLGAAVNYAVFAVLVASIPLVATVPQLGVAAGAAAGLAFNYTAAKRFVFRTAARPPDEEAS